MKKTTKKLLTIATVISPLVGCSSTDNSSDKQDVLSTLSTSQKYTLLTMLEEYEENQKAIDSWKSHEANLVRISEIEDDLKMLIIELSVLTKSTRSKNAHAKAPVNPTSPHENSLPEEAKSTVAKFTGDESIATTEKSAAPKQVANANLSSRTITTPLSTTVQSNVVDTTTTVTPRLGYAVQLTALDSIEKVKSYWSKMKKRNPDILNAHIPFYEATSNEKPNRLLRLKFGEFETFESAEAVCDKLLSKGGSCFVSKNSSGINLL